MTAPGPQPRRKVVRALERCYGWHLAREGGNHTIYEKDGEETPIPVPRHKEITVFVLKSIARTLGVSLADFLETLRNC